jgi:molecular chaperone DnaJ
LKGKGLPGLRGGRGDLHLRLRVWVPTRLSSADKKLLEELRKGDGLKAPAPSRKLFERVRDASGG